MTLELTNIRGAVIHSSQELTVRAALIEYLASIRVTDHRPTLDGIVLTGADLRGVDLSGCGLYQAQLQNTFLRGANLNNARLREADLTGVDMVGASVYATSFFGATFDVAALRGTRGAAYARVDIPSRATSLTV